MYKEMDFALYRDLYRSLTIRIAKDRFNVKKTLWPIPRLFQRSKEISVTSRSYSFFKVNNVAACRRLSREFS